jgi:hypothetical protein
MNFIKHYNRNTSRTHYTTLVRQNQKECIDLCQSSNGTIHIIPKPMEGYIEHYYHLMFDFLLPLSLVLDKSPLDIEFTTPEFGVLTPLLVNLFGDRVKIKPLSEVNPNDEQLVLMGMNPDDVRRQTKVN